MRYLHGDYKAVLFDLIYLMVNKCSVKGCQNLVRVMSICTSHHTRLLKFGDVKADIPLAYKRPNGKCSINGCNNPSKNKGMCGTHAERFRLKGSVDAEKPIAHRTGKIPAGAVCIVPGCVNRQKARGYCGGHTVRLKKYGDVMAAIPLKDFITKICRVEGCDGPKKARGLCSKHLIRFMKYGDPLIGFERSPTYKGKLWKDSDGYVYEYQPDSNSTNKYVSQHRLVMERILGRPLVRYESVHHKNGIRDDNRPENLELWTTAQKPGQRVKDLIAWAKEIISQYGEDETNY